MADRTKKGSGFPGVDDDKELNAEFDAWDDNFDAIFGDTGDAPSGSGAGQDPGWPDAESQDDSPFTGPEQAGERSDTDPIDAAAIDATVPELPARARDDLSAPIIEGRMGLGQDQQQPREEEEEEEEGVFTSALRPPEPDDDLDIGEGLDLFADIAVARPGDPDDDEPEVVIEEVTRVLSPGDELLAAASDGPSASSSAARRLPLSPDGPRDGAGPAGSSRPKRRTAAIVRREDLERKRSQQRQGTQPGGLFDDIFRERLGGDDDVDFSSETTRVAEVGQIEKMVESAEADAASARSARQAFLAKDEFDEPEIAIQVDDEFYDDIEIGEHSAEASPRFEPTPTPAGPRARRVSRNVVRRAPKKPSTTEPSTTRPSPTERRPGPASRIAASVSRQGRSLDPESTLDLRVIAEDIESLGGESDVMPSAVQIASDGVWSIEESEPSPTAGPATGGGPGEVAFEAQFGDDLEFELVTSDSDGQGDDAAAGQAAGSARQDATAVEWDDEPFEFDLIDDADVPAAVNPIKSQISGTAPAAPDPGESEVSSRQPTAPGGGFGDPAIRAGEPAGQPVDDEISFENVFDDDPDEPEIEIFAEAADGADDADDAGEMSDALAPPASPVTSLGADSVAGTIASGTIGGAGDDAREADDFAREVPTARVAPDVVEHALARERAALDAADVAPDLPAPVLPMAEPTIDFNLLSLPESVPMDQPGARRDEIVQELALLEREREIADDSPLRSRLCLESGRLAERLGEIEQARSYYEEALDADARASAAVRALRRIERSTGSWTEAVVHLDAELEQSGPTESRTLQAHGVDLLMACGEQDLARVAVGEMIDQGGGVRALLAQLELAYIDDRTDEFADTLDRLAEQLEDPELLCSLLTIRGVMAEHAARATGSASESLTADGRDATMRAVAAYRAAAQAGGRWCRTSLARAARRADEPDEIEMAMTGLGESGLAESEPRVMAALSWRQFSWWSNAGSSAGQASSQASGQASGGAIGSVAARDALGRAAQWAPDEAVIASQLADLQLAHGDHEGAASVLLALASNAPSPFEQAAAYVDAGRCVTALGHSDEAIDALRRARVLDPVNPRARRALADGFKASGDIESLIEMDRQAAIGDPGGAVFERVRAARRLVDEQRYDEAIAALAQGRAESVESRAVDEELLRVLERAGRHDERIALLFELAESGQESVDSERMLFRAAAAATERAFWLDTLLGRAVTSPISTTQRGAGDGGGGDATAGDGDAMADQHKELRDHIITRAIGAWQRVLDADPESAYSHRAAIAMADMLADPTTLDETLERAQLAAPDRAIAGALALRRMFALEAVDGERAEDIARESLALAPEDGRAAAALAALLGGQGRHGDAAAVLEDRAAAIGPGDEATSARYRAALMLLDSGDEPAPAAEALRGVLELRGGFSGAADALEAAERRLGDPVGAFSGLLDDSRRASFAHLVHAAEAYHHLAGDPATAVVLYRKALERRPRDPLARAGLVRAAEAMGDSAILAEVALAQLEDAGELGDGLAKADAYEELARIDSELRGDHASALLSYEAAAAADPGRPWVVRVVERAYLAAERWSELAVLYEREGNSLPEGRDRMALSLERARIAEMRDEAKADILSHYRVLHDQDRRCREALFHLENDARQRGPSETLAALEVDLADYFAADPVARAAFTTRAGETLTALGDIDGSLERFKVASAQHHEAIGHGYAPALFGWRHAALVGKLWVDVADAALAEAELSDTVSERAALCHLAGVALMDRAITGERAAAAFRLVLHADPRHHDAFVRLRILFDEQGEHDELIEMLDSRLEVEEDPLARARLHRALGEMYRNFLGDREGAKRHLQAILELVPNDLAAVAALSDIAWERGEWAEAAENLVTRARLESSPQIRKGIFYRLGIIHSDHVPDTDRAIAAFKKVLSFSPQDEGALDRLSRLGMEAGDWKLALASCERLLKLEHSEDTRVEYLHRVARIYGEGMGERPRAERALRMALDQAPTSDRALVALVEFFEQAGDIRSMRFHLDRAIGSMRIRLANDPGDGVAYRVIARALEARERAGVAGSLACARTAAELALLFGTDDDHDDGGDDSRQAIQILASQAAVALPGVAGLQKTDLDDRLFPASVSTSTRQLFGLLGDRVAKHVGIDLRRYSVGRGDRLRKSDDPVVRTAHDVAVEMGYDQLALYVSRKEPISVACEPTNPVSIIIGADLAKAERKAELRFCVGRALKLVASSFAVPARMSSDDFGILLVALLRHFDPEIAVAGMDADAIATQQQRLRRLIPSSMSQELKLLALDMSGPSLNPGALQEGIQAAGDRAGLLACGSMRAALTVLGGMSGHSDLSRAVVEDPRIIELVRFAVSEDHVALRGTLDS